MLVEKLYTETVDIIDPINYGSDPERYLTYLRRRYEGRCRKGAFIIKIIEIVRRSHCRIVETSLNSHGYVDVEFRALVSILTQWDILTGVEIIQRNPQMIIGKSTIEGETIGTLLATPEAEVVREKQIISIRVLQAYYSPNQTQATVIGPLLTCDKAAPVYLLSGILTPNDVDKLSSILQKIKDLMKERNELDAESVNFHERLLYSYTENKKTQQIKTKSSETWNGPDSYPIAAELVNIIELLDAAALSDVDVSGYWSRDLTIYRSSPLVAKHNELLEHWHEPVKITPLNAFATFLKNIYSFQSAINNMVKIYNTPELIESHNNIWAIMRSVQLTI